MRLTLEKVGRNDPCPCGNGKKFKRCCIDFWGQLPEMHAQANHDFDLKRQLRRRRYGDIRPIVHSEYQGRKAVVEGNRIYFLDNCKTFADFLSDYVKMQFGKKWWLEEVKKPESERHPIIQMAFDVYNAQKEHYGKDGTIFSVLPTGPHMAYLTFSYDLFVLRDNGAFQKKILSRLRLRDQFHGARYEMMVASSFAKAGFEVFYEDESDSTKKHPEFFAKHKVTGEIIAVEAKKRHRKKITDPSKIKLEVDHLLKKALDKVSDKPLAVFIDMALPPITEQIFAGQIKDGLKDLMAQDFIKTADGKDRFNLIVFTNHPTDYHKDTIPKFMHIHTASSNPLHSLKHKTSIDDIMFGVSIFDRIPRSFDD